MAPRVSKIHENNAYMTIFRGRQNCDNKLCCHLLLLQRQQQEGEDEEQQEKEEEGEEGDAQHLDKKM